MQRNEDSEVLTFGTTAVHSTSVAMLLRMLLLHVVLVQYGPLWEFPVSATVTTILLLVSIQVELCRSPP